MKSKLLQPPTVAILVTVPKDEHIVENTLVFDTLKVGFPDSKIEVYSNANNDTTNERVQQLCAEANAEFIPLGNRNHLAKWIEGVINDHQGHLVILDPDIIFYERCDTFDFPTNLAGRFVPTMWNEFAQCISYERLHTSFLWIRSCEELRETVKETYPLSWQPSGEYCPCNPYMPVVTYHSGYPMFWDCCSILFNMTGGSCFTENEMEKYSHVNSSAFQDVMLDRVEDKSAFAVMHDKARMKDLEWFRSFWKAEDKYYMKHHQTAIAMVMERSQASKQRQARNQ